MRTRAALAVALAAAGCTIDGVSGVDGGPDGETLRATFIDVGQGDGALFEMPDGAIVLVDGGDNGMGASRIVPLLEEKGIAAIDLLVLTHPHADHCGGLDEVLHRVAVAEIWENGETLDTFAYEDFAGARDDSGAAVVHPGVGELRPFGEVTLEVLAGNGGYPDENNDSIVIALEYRSVRFLLAGDAEVEEQLDLLAGADDALAADVLKVPHHGSYDFTPGFPPAVDPTWAVISSGAGNDYGHPHQEALDAYGEIGAAICRTDLQGDVEFTTKGESIESSCAQ